MRELQSMKKLSSVLPQIFQTSEEDESFAKKAYRAAQVRDMWAACVKEIFLEHTNSVYIIKKNEQKILIAYVDESIFAAELNAQRELIILKFLQQFNENISKFEIYISRGNYRKNYPFKKGALKQKNTTLKNHVLTASDIQKIETIVSVIEDKKIKENLKGAMIADWQLRDDF